MNTEILFNFQDFLESKVDQSVYKTLLVLFSNRTTAQEVQDLIMSNVDKRRKGLIFQSFSFQSLLIIS